MQQQTILLVEDDASTRELSKIILESEGYVVNTADSVASAIREFDAHTPDLIVLDYILADAKTPQAFIDHVRQFDGVPIIMVTAANLPEAIQQVLRIQAVIRKPYDLDNFIRQVHEHLQTR